jgi:hypothetical protein
MIMVPVQFTRIGSLKFENLEIKKPASDSGLFVRIFRGEETPLLGSIELDTRKQVIGCADAGIRYVGLDIS